MKKSAERYGSNEAMRCLPCKAGSQRLLRRRPPDVQRHNRNGYPTDILPHCSTHLPTCGGSQDCGSRSGIRQEQCCSDWTAALYAVILVPPIQFCVDTITGDFLLIYIQAAGILHVVYRQRQRGAAVSRRAVGSSPTGGAKTFSCPNGGEFFIKKQIL